MVELTKETFAAEVLEAEGTVLVDFYGDGCVPCQALMPHVHAMEDVYGKQIKFTALNTTKARRLAIGQKILGLPVIALYKGGEKIAERVRAYWTKCPLLYIFKNKIRRKRCYGYS